MHAYVFTDAGLAKRAGQFAWLSIDIDDEKNAVFTKKFPNQGVPFFLVIDPKTETVLQNWYGTITLVQLDKWLDDGLRALKNDTADPANAAMARADRFSVEHKPAEAVAAYREAIAVGGPKWNRFSRALESMMLTFELGGDALTQADCVKAALEYAPAMPRGQSFVNVMRVGIKCAASEKQTPGAAGRMQSGPDEAHLKILQPLAEEALKVPEGFGDDKGEIYSTLIGIAKRGNNPTGAKKYATEMWVFLEEQGRVAPNPEARASLDTWRMSAASSLNDPALALPALQASERDLPTDYNPSSRLASIYAQLGRIDEALAANQRALAKTNGDRRVSAYRTRVSLLEKKGDKAEAKKTLEEAITFAETLPAPGGPATVAALKKQLEQYNKTERGS